MTTYREDALFITSAVLRELDNSGKSAGQLAWPSFKVDFSVEFTYPIGNLTLSHNWNDPKKKRFISQTIKLKVIGKHGLIWRFVCPRQTHKHCHKTASKIWLGEDRKFACHWCAKIRSRRIWIRDQKVDFFMEYPMEIKRTLESPFAPSRDKIRALEAYGFLSRKLANLKKQLAAGMTQPPRRWVNWMKHLPSSPASRPVSSPPAPIPPPRFSGTSKSNHPKPE